MTLMWVALGAMTVIGVLIIVLPLIHFRPQQELSGDVINAAVFKDRIAELKVDLAEGRLDQAEYDQLSQELELTLLSDVSIRDGHQPRLLGGKWLVIPLALLIPVAAFVVYWSEGYHPELNQWFAKQETMARVMPLMMAGKFEVIQDENIDVADFIRALQRQLQADPEDAQGWYLLGVSYLQVQLPQQSETAFQRALNLEPNNVDFVMGYTQATLAANGGNMTPQIRGTLEQVMRAQPNNPKPYMTMGMALFQQGDFGAAIAVWERYLAQDNPDPRAVQLLQRSVEVARNQMGESAPSQPQVAGSGPSIQVTVDVAADVKTRLGATDTLFIYAKAQSGPPMPLAVVRQPVSQWPVTVTLSDANAMTPAMTLSKFKNVLVLARVSATGNAIPQSGDWEATPQPLELSDGGKQVQLVIHTQRP
ncbi:c-type cytochrome biogenesis protein CcmI [Ketobacter sp.]|uniref:c-type cytochrome biogenesis protein CcmI n=1 Tax=Ketobacter sp. TaxID=2083498 RepID=UPI000F212D38|nr:c-type cytochrome biogenesis protein CcmI [Ketobacter sp.]RLT92644.1 MAG: c-type cytochrome biogenesis protein CcmI [Ketobacter sp.]